MMNNMFSMFDPSSNLSLNLNWLVLLTPLIYMNKNYWYKNNQNSILLKMIFINFIKNNFSNFKPSLFNNSIMITSLFIYLFMSNILSVLPFTFTALSHLSISLSISLSFWLSMMIKMNTKTPKKFFIHLTPMGSPMILSPFMVIIETISNIIRPVTLAVRLSANMIAGHILLSLLSKMITFPLFKILPSYMCLLALSVLELSVCLIQAFVFTTLLSLYMEEMN